MPLIAAWVIKATGCWGCAKEWLWDCRENERVLPSSFTSALYITTPIVRYIESELELELTHPFILSTSRMFSGSRTQSINAWICVWIKLDTLTVQKYYSPGKTFVNHRTIRQTSVWNSLELWFTEIRLYISSIVLKQALTSRFQVWDGRSWAVAICRRGNRYWG